MSSATLAISDNGLIAQVACEIVVYKLSTKPPLNRLLNVSSVESPLFEWEKARSLWITLTAFSLANVLFYVPSRQRTIKCCDEF
jgi:hypothetical protein